MIFAELTNNNLVKNIVVADEKPDLNYVEVPENTLIDISFIYNKVTKTFTDPRILDDDFYLDERVEARSFYADYMRFVYNIDITFETPEGALETTTATTDDLVTLVAEQNV
jgi:hypothetical protein